MVDTLLLLIFLAPHRSLNPDFSPPGSLFSNVAFENCRTCGFGIWSQNTKKKDNSNTFHHHETLINLQEWF